jgi:hypothetical protein
LSTQVLEVASTTTTIVEEKFMYQRGKNE